MPRKSGTPCDRTLHYVHKRATQKLLYGFGAAATGATAQEAISALEANATYQTGHAQNNAFYHEILSLARGETLPHVESILVDLCQEYLRLRAPRAMAYFCVHLDHDSFSISDATLRQAAAAGMSRDVCKLLVPLKYKEYDSKAAFVSALRQRIGKEALVQWQESLVQLSQGKAPHAHIILSANEVRSSKQITLSKKEFEKIKQDAEKYQVAMYPELKHSITALSDKAKAKHNKQPKYTTKVTGKAKTKVEHIRAVAEHIFQHATTETEVHEQFALAQLRLYQRGKTWGIEDDNGTRYRVTRLGLAGSLRAMAQRLGPIPKQESKLDVAHDQKRQQKNEQGIAL